MSLVENEAEEKVSTELGLRSEGGVLDRIDAAILRELSADARIARAEQARRVGLSAPASQIGCGVWRM